jgi:copper chaperone CopZ
VLLAAGTGRAERSRASEAASRRRYSGAHPVLSASFFEEFILLLRFCFAAAILLLASAVPARAESLTFTVVGIDCEACAPPILRTLKSVSGVREARLDWKSGVATIEVRDGFDREKVRAALRESGFEAVFAGEQRKDLEPVSEEIRRTLDIAPAGSGEKIDVSKTLVAGKVTILDYWAEWCSPCHLLDTRLQHLLLARPNLAVRRVDVGKWDNAAARQATSEFRAAALPYVRVYDAAGKFVGAETGGSWDRIVKLIDKAAPGN